MQESHFSVPDTFLSAIESGSQLTASLPGKCCWPLARSVRYDSLTAGGRARNPSSTGAACSDHRTPGLLKQAGAVTRKLLGTNEDRYERANLCQPTGPFRQAVCGRYADFCAERARACP